MPRGLGRLPLLRRRSSASDRGASDASPGLPSPVDPDDAPVGPPILLPATIVRQVLVEATELVPLWARPRPAPEPVVTAEPVLAAAESAPPSDPAPTKQRRRAASRGTAKAARVSTDGRTSSTPRQRRKKDAG